MGLIETNVTKMKEVIIKNKSKSQHFGGRKSVYEHNRNHCSERPEERAENVSRPTIETITIKLSGNSSGRVEAAIKADLPAHTPGM